MPGDIGTQSLDASGLATGGDMLVDPRLGHDPGQPLASLGQPAGECLLRVSVGIDEGLRIVIEGLSLAHDGDPLVHVGCGHLLDAEAEAVEQLGAQLALVGFMVPISRNARDGNG